MRSLIGWTLAALSLFSTIAVHAGDRAVNQTQPLRGLVRLTPVPAPSPPAKPLQGSVKLYTPRAGSTVLQGQNKMTTAFGNAQIMALCKGSPVAVSHDGAAWSVHKYVPAYNTWITTRAFGDSKLHCHNKVAFGQRYVAILDPGYSAVSLNDPVSSESQKIYGYYDPTGRPQPVGKDGIARLNKELRGGWLCNIETGQWTEIPERAPAAYHHDFIGDTLLAWGGCEGGAILDPSTLRWRNMPPAPIETNRYRAIHAVVGNKFIVWSGFPSYTGGMDDGAIFDLATFQWTKLPRAPISGCYGATACAWRSNFVLVSGRTSQIAMFDTNTNRWSEFPSRPFRDANPGSGWTNVGAEVSGDKMLVWVGNYKSIGAQLLEHMDPGAIKTAKSNTERFRAAVCDLVRGSWTEVPDCPLSQRWHTNSYPANGGVYVYSGWDPNQCSARPQFDVNEEPVTMDVSATAAHSLRDGAFYSFDRRTWVPIAEIPGDTPKFALFPSW